MNIIFSIAYYNMQIISTSTLLLSLHLLDEVPMFLSFKLILLSIFSSIFCVFTNGKLTLIFHSDLTYTVHYASMHLLSCENVFLVFTSSYCRFLYVHVPMWCRYVYHHGIYDKELISTTWLMP